MTRKPFLDTGARQRFTGSTIANRFFIDGLAVIHNGKSVGADDVVQQPLKVKTTEFLRVRRAAFAAGLRAFAAGIVDVPEVVTVLNAGVQAATFIMESILVTESEVTPTEIIRPKASRPGRCLHRCLFFRHERTPALKFLVMTLALGPSAGPHCVMVIAGCSWPRMIHPPHVPPHALPEVLDVGIFPIALDLPLEDIFTLHRESAGRGGERGAVHATIPCRRVRCYQFPAGVVNRLDPVAPLQTSPA